MVSSNVISSAAGIDRPKKASYVKVRLLIALMGALCPVVCYMSRQNLNMAIIAMIKEVMIKENQTQFHEQELNNDDSWLIDARGFQVPNSTFNANRSVLLETFGPKYSWTANEKTLILEAFFYTYTFIQIPAGRFAELIGAHWILLVATVGSSLLSLISPFAASWHPYAFASLRVIMGICQAALYPACYILYTRWLPPIERSRALPALGVGAYIGSIVASTTTGWFMGIDGIGWEYAFYLPFVLCALWSIVWIFIGASSPREHKFISLEELEYIESTIVQSTGIGNNNNNNINNNNNNNTIKEKPELSWWKILTSRHIWAMSAAFFASNWAFSIIMALLPQYIQYVLEVQPSYNGLINAIIYALYCFSSPIVGAVSTLMIETRACGLNRLQIRKLFQSIAIFSQAIGFLILPLLGKDVHLALGLLFSQIVFFSFINGGEVQLPAELSLDFAGTIYAIGNTVGSSTSFLAPRVHNWVFGDEQLNRRDLWNTYFKVAATITTIGGVLFVIFGKNDLQDFSKETSPKNNKKMKKKKNGSKLGAGNRFQDDSIDAYKIDMNQHHPCENPFDLQDETNYQSSIATKRKDGLQITI